MASSLPIVEAIHTSRARLSFCVCGAGTLAVANLTQVAGCSQTLVFAETLYARAAMHNALDYARAHAVAPVVARQLAQHAFETGRRLDRTASTAALFGVGATSAVHTIRQRHGQDRAYVCVWGGATRAAGWAVTYALDIPSDWSRVEQDGVVAALIVQATARAVASPEAGTDEAAALFSVADGCVARVESRLPIGPAETAVAELAQAVVSGEVGAVLWNRHGEVRVQPRQDKAAAKAAEGATPHTLQALYGSESTEIRPRSAPGCPPLSSDGFLQLLYPGSFRPLHWGHTELARAASTVMRRVCEQCSPSTPAPRVTVTYELAATVVDKGSVSVESLTQRVQQFLDRGERVAITPARLFVEKAKLFPGHGFIVGIDTAERILDPQYYEGGDEAGMVHALLRDIDAQGCYFVVGGRVEKASSQLSAEAKQAAAWLDMTSLSVPEPVRHLFHNFSEKDFRVDVSSTELRTRMGIQ